MDNLPTATKTSTAVPFSMRIFLGSYYMLHVICFVVHVVFIDNIYIICDPYREPQKKGSIPPILGHGHFAQKPAHFEPFWSLRRSCSYVQAAEVETAAG